MATTLHSKQASISGVQKTANFCGHVFGGGINARGAVFEALADFKGAVFHGAADFSGAIFRDGADFSGARFIPKNNTEKEDVSFLSSIFLSETNFSGVSFDNTGNVDFSQASFSGQGNALFLSAVFKNSGSVNFTGAVFKNLKGVEFSDAAFQNGRDVLFSGISFACKRIVSFTRTKFANSGKVHFYRNNFINDSSATFSYAAFTCRDGAEFSENVFTNDGRVLFYEADFAETRMLVFSECIFAARHGVDFSLVRFPSSGETLFSRCYFKGSGKKEDSEDFDVTFENSAFRETSFEGGEIKWLSDITKANPKTIPLDALIEAREAELERSRASSNIGPYEIAAPAWTKGLSIRTPELLHVFDEDALVSWCALSTDSSKNLTFRRVNLHKSVFDGVTLSNVQLNAVNWLSDGSRDVLYSERILKDRIKRKELRRGTVKFKSALDDLADQYTQLKNNLETKRSYAQAGNFHYGEMETMRMGFNAIWRALSLTNLYRISSGYGERPGRALFYTLFLASCLTFFAMASLDYYSPSFVDASTDGFVSAFIKLYANFASPFWKATEDSAFSSMNSENWWFFVITFVGRIIFYLQTTIFALTLRRRFKR
ncbi:MAG: pentapeptide repeat-containing protein [Deltaproteobacteria bacterium]|nr:pentapeptide repeat-containing protein [Deltaproteobacteria bacterium]